MHNSNEATFKQVIKSTTIFSSLQLFNIIINIVRSKTIAVFLGPNGIGIYSLISSSLSLVSGISNFGLSTSAVKSVSDSNIIKNKNLLRKELFVIYKVAWFTGFLGLILTILFSNKLSLIAFGNLNYSKWFIFLSISILINQITVSFVVYLQGIGDLKNLAKANFLSTLISFLCSIPFYYFAGEKSIYISIILTSVISLFFSIIYALKSNFQKIKITNKKLFFKSLKLIKIGFLISLSFLMSTISTYILQVYITKHGGVSEVGLYMAGFAIINNYVGIIFSAMSTEYYPRLTKTSFDLVISRRVINQQAEIVLLILAPIMTFFIIFIKFIITILYSSSFLILIPMMYWAALGIFFKSIGWPIAYYFLAKGIGRIYFINELTAVLYTLGLSIAGYYFYGLTGLGIAYLISQFFYLIQCFFVSYYYFNFTFTPNLLKYFLTHFTIALFAIFIVFNHLSLVINYITGTLLFLISMFYSLHELNKKTDILNILKFKLFNK
jgi:O-antigen/teichoic acid export membrane protein